MIQRRNSKTEKILAKKKDKSDIKNLDNKRYDTKLIVRDRVRKSHVTKRKLK